MIWIILIFILIGLGSIGAAIVGMVLHAKKTMKQRAYKLLEQAEPDTKLIKQTISQLSALSAGKDVEAAELVRQLMTKMGGKVVNLGGR